MQVRLGIFVVPDATDPASTVGQILAADETELDSTLLVGIPDDDPIGFIRRLGEDVAPAVRALVS